MRCPVWGWHYLRSYFIGITRFYTWFSIGWLIFASLAHDFAAKSNEVLSYTRRYFEDFIRTVFLFKVQPFIIFWVTIKNTWSITMDHHSGKYLIYWLYSYVMLFWSYSIQIGTPESGKIACTLDSFTLGSQAKDSPLGRDLMGRSANA